LTLIIGLNLPYGIDRSYPEPINNLYLYHSGMLATAVAILQFCRAVRTWAVQVEREQEKHMNCWLSVVAYFWIMNSSHVGSGSEM